ncbi:MAG: DUF1697 domain-containing protein [Candidatus Devosia symbiotica]|nr:DUF1697 domain-containing protein [Candidatus Devosia symbiotica]
MSRHLAFLRGINLGERQIKMADLKTCLAGIGLCKIKAIVASGNVRFETTDSHDLKACIEAAISKQFGFDVGVMLRSENKIEAMLAGTPFD